MKTVSLTRRILSIILKLIVIVSATTGILISSLASRNTFMGGGKLFMFFTIQSNIAIALICLAGLVLLLRDKPVGSVLHVIKFFGTVSITLTGAVFAFVLAPTMGGRAWSLPNTLTHLVVPVAAVIDFFVIACTAGIKKRNVFFVIIPPILYAIYAGIGYVKNWEFATGVNYPYFFLNWGSPAGAFGFTDGLPFMGCAWWILVLLLFLIGIGYLYLVIADLIGRKLISQEVAK